MAERKEHGRVNKKSEEWAINRTLVDTCRAVDILFYRTFKAMRYKDGELTNSIYNVHGFNKEITKPKGEIVLRILLGEIDTEVTLCVVDIDSPYNMLLGRPWVHAIKAVASKLHQCIRFPIPSGIGEIKGDIADAKFCNEVDIKNYEGRAKKRKDRWRREKELKKEEEFCIYMIRAKEVKGIPSEIPEERTINILREYNDVFAWRMEEMPGIDPSVACHRLDIKKNAKPFKQRIRKIATTYHPQIETELQKMLQEGIIRLEKYPEWIANMVVVPKRNKGIRICIDFTDLNKACPKDSFPLPDIPQMVESAS
ncbi:uncharacterized protein LOC113324883 [Papaver somniferum]|uniref:uncharacterized protein LOC113324883 n=1 Tax=Papaver somniferum TaxID=3469 RepID=UPI000E70038F|nr:uncharacterized protein LOC113324883 [Papaver somniferum]